MVSGSEAAVWRSPQARHSWYCASCRVTTGGTGLGDSELDLGQGSIYCLAPTGPSPMGGGLCIAIPLTGPPPSLLLLPSSAGVALDLFALLGVAPAFFPYF